MAAERGEGEPRRPRTRPELLPQVDRAPATAAASAPVREPTRAPPLNAAWKEDITGRPTARSTVTAWAFMATSRPPNARPKTRREAEQHRDEAERNRRAGRSHPAASPGTKGAGQGHRDERPDGGHEQRTAERRLRERERLLDVRDPDRPIAEHDPVDREDGEDREARRARSVHDGESITTRRTARPGAVTLHPTTAVRLDGFSAAGDEERRHFHRERASPSRSASRSAG